MAWLLLFHLTTTFTLPNTIGHIDGPPHNDKGTDDQHQEGLILPNSTFTNSSMTTTLASAPLPLLPSPASSPPATLGERCGSRAAGPDNNVSCAEGLRSGLLRLYWICAVVSYFVDAEWRRCQRWEGRGGPGAYYCMGECLQEGGLTSKVGFTSTWDQCSSTSREA